LGQGEPEPKPASVLLFWVQSFAKMQKKGEYSFHKMSLFLKKISKLSPKKILNFVWPINFNFKSFLKLVSFTI
jgi:hypothetical protein